jgi:hypothetical protein
MEHVSRGRIVDYGAAAKPPSNAQLPLCAKYVNPVEGGGRASATAVSGYRFPADVDKGRRWCPLDANTTM